MPPTKPRLTIELHVYPKAVEWLQRSYLWRCTLPNGASRTCGCVSLFGVADVLASPKVRKWVERGGKPEPRKARAEKTK